jgi:hypothetical protein
VDTLGRETCRAKILTDNVSTISSGMNRQMSNMTFLPFNAHDLKPPFLDAVRIMIAAAITGGTDAATRAVDHTSSAKGAPMPSRVLVPRRFGSSQITGRAPAGEVR